MSKFPRAVCLLMQRPDGLILAVSRKNDRTKFGLPGGKVEAGETTEAALTREVLEETGLLVSKHQWVFSAVCKGDVDYISTTYYVGDVSGELRTDEAGAIEWVTPETLLAGPFGDYNRRLFKHVGIKFKDESSFTEKEGETRKARISQ